MSDDFLPDADEGDAPKPPLPLAPPTEFQPPEDRRSHLPEPPPISLVAVEDARLPVLARQRAELDSFYLDLLHFRLDESQPLADRCSYRAENFRVLIDLHPDHFERISRRPLVLRHAFIDG